MRLRDYLLMFPLSSVLLASAAFADDDKPVYSNRQWSLYAENSSGHFWDCDAIRNNWDGNSRLAFYQTFDGYLYVQISGVLAYVDPGSTSADGYYQLDGGTPVAFKNARINDSTLKPGEKYADMDVAFELMDKMSRARTITFSFPKGAVKFPLQGASDVIDHVTSCIDNGLVTDQGSGGDNSKIYKPPNGWKADIHSSASAPLLFFGAENPSGPKGAFALVQMKDGTYTLRLRDAQADLKTGPDGGKREAASVDLGSGASSMLVNRKDTAVDITGLTAADIQKLPSSGSIKVTSLEPGANFTHDYAVGVDIGAAGKALLSPTSANDPPTPSTLAGKYYVRGRGNDGKYYYGDAEVSADGNTKLKIAYTWSGGKTLNSKGVMFGQILTALGDGDKDPYTYKIGLDHVWRGAQWGSGQAFEYFVPKGN